MGRCDWHALRHCVGDTVRQCSRHTMQCAFTNGSFWCTCFKDIYTLCSALRFCYPWGVSPRPPPPHLLASGLCWSPANTCACGGVSARNVAARVPSKFREGRRPFSGGQLCGRCVVRAMHGLLIGGTSRVHPLVLIPSPCMRWWSSRRGQPASLIASRLA